VDSRADLQAALDNDTYRFISSRQRNSEIRELVNPIFRFIELFLGVASDAAGLVSLIHQSITSKEFLLNHGRNPLRAKSFLARSQFYSM
jgi:hypothetical protein